MKKKQVVIWGIGNSADEVYEALDFSVCDIFAVVDQSKTKHGERWKEQYEILFPEEVNDDRVDFYIITSKTPDSIVKHASELGIISDKIVLFWSRNPDNSIFKKKYLNKRKSDLQKMRHENAPYEKGESLIRFMDNAELFRMLKDNRLSFARFGDGEFEIIRGVKRGWFQHRDDVLSKRLLEILTEKQDRVIIGIADNFGNLDKYTEDAADAIREYLSGDTREGIMSFLPTDRVYADAYVTRFYLMYQDKSNAERIINSFKAIWRNRDVMVVEGKYGRMGIGNDLLADAKSIRRIICPHKDAFDSYALIKDTVMRNVDDDTLVLASLGQTATVLAYELGIQGIQAIDIGQLDTEYEWFIKKAENREEIPGKSVSEIPWWHEPDFEETTEYLSQIVARIQER